MYYIVNSLGWFGLGVYAQWAWEYLTKEAPSGPRKSVADN